MAKKAAEPAPPVPPAPGWRERVIAAIESFYLLTVKPLGLRTLVLGAAGAWLLSRDWQAAQSFAFGLGLVCMGLAFLHWLRKFVMPYLDLEPLVAKALTEPQAAAIVVAASFARDAAILLFLLFVVVR